MQLNKKSCHKKLINSLLKSSNNNCIVFAGLGCLVIALFAFSVNWCCFKFHGNNYFPPGSLTVAISLVLITAGCRLLFTKQHYSYLITRELVFFFLVMAIIALMTNAVQFTPFPIIDPWIIAMETPLGISMPAIVDWTTSYPALHRLLTWVYASLDYQMAFIPILLILVRKTTALREYYFLLLFSALIGFTFYYFFPTVAPATMSKSTVFLDAQRATGIKFYEIRAHLQPSTLEGGMIAMPSFHALWAWFCLYFCRAVSPLFWLLLPINIVLVVSCVLLGWHYPLDLLGSILVGVITHCAYYYCAGRNTRTQ